MQFYFIRHAQSANNAMWASTGSNLERSEDPDLTELGVRQARSLADFLALGDARGGCRCDESREGGFGLTHLYSSLMIRSVKTGAIVAKRLGLKLEALQEIHERGGIYLEDHEGGEIEYLPGRSRSYFSENYPDLVLPETFIDAGWWDRRPVESPEDSLGRARAFLQGLRDRHANTDDRVAVISHGGFYNDFLASLLGLQAQSVYWFTLYNTAITRIKFDEDWVELVYQNRVEHLTPEMVT